MIHEQGTDDITYPLVQDCSAPYNSPTIINQPPQCLSRTNILSSNDHHAQSGPCTVSYKLRFALELIPFVFSGHFPSSSPQRPIVLATIA